MGLDCLNLRSSPDREGTCFSCLSCFSRPSRTYKRVCILYADRIFTYEDTGAGRYGLKAEANPPPT